MVPWPVEWRRQQQPGGAGRLAHPLRMANAQAETIRPSAGAQARGLATAQGTRDCKASPHAVPKPAEIVRSQKQTDEPVPGRSRLRRFREFASCATKISLCSARFGPGRSGSRGGTS